MVFFGSPSVFDRVELIFRHYGFWFFSIPPPIDHQQISNSSFQRHTDRSTGTEKFHRSNCKLNISVRVNVSSFILVGAEDQGEWRFRADAQIANGSHLIQSKRVLY